MISIFQTEAILACVLSQQNQRSIHFETWNVLWNAWCLSHVKIFSRSNPYNVSWMSPANHPPVWLSPFSLQLHTSLSGGALVLFLLWFFLLFFRFFSGWIFSGAGDSSSPLRAVWPKNKSRDTQVTQSTFLFALSISNEMNKQRHYPHLENKLSI